MKWHLWQSIQRLFFSTRFNLSNVRLTHQIMDLPRLDRYLKVISYDLQRHQLTTKLFSKNNMYSYYVEPPVSFTYSADKLFVKIPILLKHFLQVSLLLYSIQTVLVLTKKHTQEIAKNILRCIFSNLLQQCHHIHILLDVNDTSTYAHTWELHIAVKKKTNLLIYRFEHTCTSATYYQIDLATKAMHLKAKHTINLKPDSAVLDA